MILQERIILVKISYDVYKENGQTGEVMRGKVNAWIKGLLVSYVVTAMVLVILSLLIYKLHWSSAVVNVCIICTYIIANALGSHIVAAFINHKRLPVGILFGIFYFLILLCVSLIVKDAMISSLWQTVKILFICVGGAVAGSIL